MYNNWLILDCNFLCHRAKYAMPNLEHGDIKTGIVCGFLYDMLRVQTRYKSSHIVFCWDSRHSKRKEIYPEYKANRLQKEKTPEEQEMDVQYHIQTKLLRQRYLPAIGFKNIFIQGGYESDDLIASICKNLPQGDTATIVSNDGDLFQLLTYKVIMFNIQKQQEVTTNSFIKEWGIDPTLWGTVKSLAGCGTDNVKGIPGVGEKKAISFLKKEMNPQTDTYKKIQANHQKTIAQNCSLVVLPFSGTKVFPLVEDKLSIEGWKKVIRHIGAESLKGVYPEGMVKKNGR